MQSELESLIIVICLSLILLSLIMNTTDLKGASDSGCQLLKMILGSHTLIKKNNMTPLEGTP